MPALRAVASVERNQVIVGGDKEEIGSPYPHTAISDVSAPSRLPEVMPQLVAVASIECPCVVGCRDVQDAVDLKYSAVYVRGARGHDVARTFSTDDQRRNAGRTLLPAGIWSVGQTARPRERQVFHAGLVDLGQGAVTPSAVITRICRPGIRKRLRQRSRFASLRGKQGRRYADPKRNDESCAWGIPSFR